MISVSRVRKRQNYEYIALSCEISTHCKPNTWHNTKASPEQSCITHTGTPLSFTVSPKLGGTKEGYSQRCLTYLYTEHTACASLTHTETQKSQGIHPHRHRPFRTELGRRRVMFTTHQHPLHRASETSHIYSDVNYYREWAYSVHYQHTTGIALNMIYP